MIAKYREKMVGEGSLWQTWREGLPKARCWSAPDGKVQAWSHYRDPRPQTLEARAADRARAPRPASALGWSATKIGDTGPCLRRLPLMHDVGRWAAKSNHHKKSYKLIMKFPHPLSWEPEMIKRRRVSGALSPRFPAANHHRAFANCARINASWHSIWRASCASRMRPRKTMERRQANPRGNIAG